MYRERLGTDTCLRRMKDARTAEDLYQRALAAGLRPGTRIRVVLRSKKYPAEPWVVRGRQRGVVLEVHPYIFVCEVGGMRTSYRYNELFGDEAVRIAMQGVME